MFVFEKSAHIPIPVSFNNARYELEGPYMTKSLTGKKRSRGEPDDAY